MILLSYKSCIMVKEQKDVTSVLILILSLILYTEGQADSILFPEEVDCIKVVCNGTETIECCNQSGLGTQEDNNSTLAFAIATTIGSLATVISVSMCCWKFYQPCWKYYNEPERPVVGGRRVRTISAGVQTTTATSDAPPAYEWANPDKDLTKISIPQCPSYIKDPPQYSEHFLTDFINDTERNDTTIIEISVQESPQTRHQVH